MFDRDFVDPYEEHLQSQPSSMSELIREQTYYDGQFCPQTKWLLSDLDTWERNPHYKNLKPWLVDDSHPEDEYPRPVTLRVIQCNAYRQERAVHTDEDDLPF